MTFHELASQAMSRELDAIHARQPAPAEPPAPALEPGTVLYASWGYEQTNIDFYRVEKCARGFVTLQKLETIDTPDEPDEPDGPATLTGQAVAGDTTDAKPFRRKLHRLGDRLTVAINDYTYAYPWDGRPKRTSHYA